MNYNRAIVSGGAGFIGSHLVDKLISSGYEVCVIDNLRNGGWNNIDKYRYHSNCMLESQNVQDPGIENIFKVFRPDVVFHLAAIPGVYNSIIEPTKTAETNIVGTANMLAQSEKFGVKRFVFASSSSVYGGAESFPTCEGEYLNPKSPYAFQKITGEEYCRYYSKNTELDTVSLRYFNVFGPRQPGNSAYSAVIPAFLEAKKKNMVAHIHGDGEQTRDFCFVDNIVHANLLAAQADQKLCGGAFNIGCGDRISVNQIYDIISPGEVMYVDDRPGDVKDSCAGISKAKEVFGYEPLVSFEEGISKTIDWYMNEK